MKRTTIVLCLLFAGMFLNGQEIDKALPGGIFGGLNANDDGVVGTIGGIVDVSAMGGATYTIPVLLPEGVNGIQPKLSISYNSQTGNGLMGWGWNLGGLSAITRTGQCMFYDDTITSVDFENDRFLLDGQRLMLVNEGPYGSNGAEYKTEIDGMNRIISYTCDSTRGPAMFTVWLANGDMAYYGSRYDSRIGLKKHSDVCLWLLDSVVDRNGNYMSYHYYRGNIMYYLDYIEYTGNKTEDTLVSPQYKVKLIYEQGERLDKEHFFVGNYSLWQTKLLKGIKVYHLPSGALQHQYDFEYSEMGLYPNQYSYEGYYPPSELAYYYNRLKTISFSKDKYHYNPTRIEWGENDYTEENNRHMHVVTQNTTEDEPSSYESFNNLIKFAGDFNGDGLTDIVVYENGTPDRVRTYINQGNSRIPEQNHFLTKLRFRQLPDYLQLNDNTDWIYVADFNGDGLDDLLCLNRDRSGLFRDKIYLTGYFARLNQGEVVFDSIPTEDPYYRIKKSYAEAILIGDFLGEGRCQFYMQTYDPSKEEEDSEAAYLFQYQNGEFKKTNHVNNAFLYAEKFTAADFNGDGVTEIIYSSESSPNYQMVRLTKRDGENGFRYHSIGNLSGGPSYSHKLFLGDFNGDGNTDLLTYVPGPNGSTGTWQINLFKGDKLEIPSYTINAEDIGIGDPGDHAFSLHNRMNINFKFIEIADMNGDGKSDIVIKRSHGENSVLRVLFAPIRRVNGATRFADIQEYSLYLYGINNDQTACVGNFFGSETACVAFTTLAWSKMPISNRYGVKNIIDGMGNRTSFSFGYLTYNPLNNNNIYTLYNPGTNLGNDIYHIALPLKAVKEIQIDNAYNNTVPVAKTHHTYTNAFAHRKGRGFLGFERTITENTIGSVTKSKTVSDNEIGSMGSYCLAMPSTTKVYDGQDCLLSDTEYAFRKFKCIRDPKNKVFITKPIKQITDNYEILGDRSFLRRKITEYSYYYSYNVSNTIFYYNDAVLAKTTNIGTHGTMVESVNDCDYLTSITNQYQPDDYVHWVIGRPKNIVSTKRKLNDNNIIKGKTTYEYSFHNPFLASIVSNYPNEENTLGTYTMYDYNNFGLVTEEATGSIVGNLRATKTYQYSPDGRFLETESTVSTDCGIYTNSFEYNPYFGHLRKAKDCNGFGKYTSNSDRMGITVYSTDLDPQGNAIGGSGLNQAVRWLEGSGYERFGYFLPEAVYFTWQWQQGKAESLVIYDAAGRELRNVSFGLTLNDTIYVDTRYDTQGRVNEVTDPYFVDDGPFSVGKTCFEYDNYDRPTQTTIYDKNGGVLSVTQKSYFGLETTTTNYRSNNNKEKVSDGLNIMGWKTGHLDFLDPDDVFNPASQVLVQYDYYADGKLAWAKTTSNGNNSNNDTKVTMQYDALGNRTRLADPDYGTVDSRYDAFGRLCWTASPKGDTTAYEYDGLGRLIVRSETDHVDNTSVITRWYYSDDEGRKGLLDSIWYDGGQQVVHYSYDTLNRVIQVTETRGNQNYSTSYEYDEFSRVTAIEYPSHYVTRNAYSHGTGHLITIMNNDGKMIWELNELNAMGQIVEFQTGDGTISKRDYDYMYRLETQLAKNGNNIIQDFTYVYDDFSNLAARTENKYAIPMTESFTYDCLNRLDSIKFNNVASIMTYDPHGRILGKQADGHTVFDNAQYAAYGQNNLLKPHAISSASVTDGFLPSPHLEATYTTFDKVKRLAKYDDNDNVERTLDYTYGYDHQRVHMVDSVGNSLFRKKTYVGNCEYNHDPDCERTLTYLSAPSGVFAVHLQEGGYYLDNVTQVSQRLLYLHKDHLGSITTITDASGTIQQELSFDAWGNLRNPATWSGSFTGTPLIDRGFTSHEHLYDFGLINMNGRMYDPVMSSFLSVDNYIQAPNFSQSFNRYAYCLNNPLIYIDPTGEKWWHWALSDVLSGGFLSSTVLVTAEFTLTTVTTAGVTAYTMPLPYGETGYMKQQYDSPIAFQLDVRYGTHQRGVGFNISIGLPKSLPYAKRWEWGSSYYWKNYGNYRGYEHRKGSEQSVLGLYHWGKTHYESGEFTQTVGNKNIGMPSIAGVDISNDLWGDQGDRYRTSYQRINLGPIRIENAIFTGDPGPSGERFEYVDKTLGPYGTYIGSENPYYNPDKYRHGVLSIGIGPLNIGADTEGIRNFFQNGVHDMESVASPRFRDLRGTPEYEAMGGDRFYFQFGYYRIW